MRARLLDLGEVGPVRSQSAYHAVLAGIEADDDPVLFLVRPAGSLVSVGDTSTLSEEIDFQVCLEEGLPLVGRRIGGPTEIVGEHDLLIQIVVPREKISMKAVTGGSLPVLSTLAGLGIEATASEDGCLHTEAGRLGHVHTAVVDSALCVAYCLYWNQRPFAQSGGGSSSLTAQMEAPISFADLAELLLEAIEAHFSLESFPSLPTPSELEAIYEWDRRLLIENLEEALFKPTATALVH